LGKGRKNSKIKSDMAVAVIKIKNRFKISLKDPPFFIIPSLSNITINLSLFKITHEY